MLQIGFPTNFITALFRNLRFSFCADCKAVGPASLRGENGLSVCQGADTVVTGKGALQCRRLFPSSACPPQGQ